VQFSQLFIKFIVDISPFLGGSKIALNKHKI
jgi:hypothetical protein